MRKELDQIEHALELLELEANQCDGTECLDKAYLIRRVRYLVREARLYASIIRRHDLDETVFELLAKAAADYESPRMDGRLAGSTYEAIKLRLGVDGGAR